MPDSLIPAVLVVALAALVAVLGSLRALQARRGLRRRQLDALRLIRLLRRLMDQVQVHRGLVSRLLNGDQSQRVPVSAKQAEIAATLRELGRQDDPSLLTPSRMARIRDYWQDIESRFQDLTPGASFERHSALIRQVLFLIGDTADNGRLAELPGLAPSLHALWDDLPAAAEAIGQARAVGAGVAAAGQCDSVSRIRLRYLHQRLAVALQGLQSLPEATPACPPKVERLLMELEQHLLLPPTPTTAAGPYFQVASEALESVYAVFERATTQLEQRLASGRA